MTDPEAVRQALIYAMGTRDYAPAVAALDALVAERDAGTNLLIRERLRMHEQKQRAEKAENELAQAVAERDKWEDRAEKFREGADTAADAWERAVADRRQAVAERDRYRDALEFYRSHLGEWLRGATIVSESQWEAAYRLLGAALGYQKPEQKTGALAQPCADVPEQTSPALAAGESE